MNCLPGLQDGRLRDLRSLRRGPLGRALEALNGDGEETRLVGGAVRDLILGLGAQDLDLATTARPDEVIRRAGAAGFTVATPGVSHGTVTLIVDGRPIETTTLREDVETNGRHAKVSFSRDFSSDARRRDFTINALSISADGLVHDPVGGLEDLAAGRVRFIGDADARIREDYLRILRFFRFSARFGEGAVDAEGLSAAIRNRLAIAGLSRERVRMEMLKIVAAPHAGAVVRTMGESGILGQALGFAYKGRFNRAIAIETARSAKTDALLRLAALAVMIPEDAERLRERLRLANADYERIARAAQALTGLHGIRAPPPEDRLRVLLFSAGRQSARDALFLAEADSGARPDDPAFADGDRFLSVEPAPEVPVSGSDLIARGVEEGPRVRGSSSPLPTALGRSTFPQRPGHDRPAGEDCNRNASPAGIRPFLAARFAREPRSAAPGRRSAFARFWTSNSAPSTSAAVAESYAAPSAAKCLRTAPSHRGVAQAAHVTSAEVRPLAVEPRLSYRPPAGAVPIILFELICLDIRRWSAANDRDVRRSASRLERGEHTYAERAEISRATLQALSAQASREVGRERREHRVPDRPVPPVRSRERTRDRPCFHGRGAAGAASGRRCAPSAPVRLPGRACGRMAPKGVSVGRNHKRERDGAREQALPLVKPSAPSHVNVP